MIRNKRKRVLASFNPLTDSAVLAWFNVSNATSDANGVSVIPDARGGGSMTQSVDAQKPALGSTANGLPMLTCTDDVMFTAIAGVHTNLTQRAVSMWIRPSNLTGAKKLYAVITGTGAADVNQVEWTLTVNDFRTRIWQDASNVRQGLTARAAAFSTGWQFVTMSLNLATGEAESLRNAMKRECAPIPVPQATVYSDSQGTTAGTPATLRAATGNILWFADSNIGGNPFVGNVGPDIWVHSPAISLDKHAAMMNWRVPTDG